MPSLKRLLDITFVVKDFILTVCADELHLKCRCIEAVFGKASGALYKNV